MSRYFRFCIFGFLGGVAFASLFHFGMAFSLFAAFLGFIVFVVSRSASANIIFSVVLLSFAFGCFRVEMVPTRADSFLKDFTEKQIVLEGIVKREPDVRENSTRLVVGVANVQSDAGQQEFQRVENILVVTKKYPEFEYGDKIKLQGKIAFPENFANENGREFDYISYLAKDGIFYEMAFPKITALAEGEGNPLIAFLYSIKNAAMNQVSRILPEPEAGLLNGLLFGAKRALGSETMEMFRVAGIVHIVVLSGYNITIIADFFTRAFLFFPISKMAASLGGGISVILFAVMSGLGASTLRAVLMALLAIFARATGRTADAIHLLFVAAFCMIFWNPLSLLYDPSFQLSFLATLGLLLFGPELSRRLLFVTEKFGLRETLSATLSTQVFVLPLLLYETGLLSIVAIPVNLLVLPLLPFAMFFGSLAALLGFITPFGTFFGFPVFLLLSFVFLVSSFFAGLPHSSFSIPPFSISFLVTVYFLYTIIYFVYRKKQNAKNKPPE